MAVSLESTYLLQSLLGVAVASLGIGVAGVLLLLPGKTPQRWIVAILLALFAATQFNKLRFLQADIPPWGPTDPWYLWYQDVNAVVRILWVGFFALVPTPVRWRSLRGAVLLVAGAHLLMAGLGWLVLGRRVALDASISPFELSAWEFVRDYGQDAWLFLSVLSLIAVTVRELRARGPIERRDATFVLLAPFTFVFDTFGRNLVLQTYGGFGLSCCSTSFLNNALFTLGAAAVMVYLWRAARSWAPVALAVFGGVTIFLVIIAPLSWGYWEVNIVTAAIFVMVAAQRRNVFGPLRPPLIVSFGLALLAAVCVFMTVNAYTLTYDQQIVVASGIFVGAGLGVGAGVAMLPRGLLAIPTHVQTVEGDRALAAYRTAVHTEISSGLAGPALSEKLRPLRAELGLSDRDHAVLEHALRAGGPALGVALREGDVLLGRYRIERLIGQGGSGQVYLARDEKLARRVALKRLTQDEKRDRAALERFQKETRLASALHHPNIVAVHDIEIVGNEAYLVMEYVAGGSVEERLREAKLPEADVRRIALDVLSALDALHAQGIIHRDVKPSNILLDAKGRAKLSDFSVARAVVSGETVGFTREGGAPVGTPAYMAPEQARGLAATPRSDVYSLGASLYAALTGKAPVAVDGLSEFEARMRVASETPSLPVAGVSNELNDVLARALARDPFDRWPSATAMREALAP